MREKAPNRQTVVKFNYNGGWSYEMSTRHVLGFRVPSGGIIRDINKAIADIKDPEERKAAQKTAAEQLLGFRDSEIESKKPGGKDFKRRMKRVWVVGGATLIGVGFVIAGKLNPLILSSTGVSMGLASVVGENVSPELRAKRLTEAATTYARASGDQELIDRLEGEKKAKEKERVEQREPVVVTFQDGYTITAPHSKLGFRRPASKIIRDIDNKITSIKDPEERYTALESAADQLIKFIVKEAANKQLGGYDKDQYNKRSGLYFGSALTGGIATALGVIDPHLFFGILGASSMVKLYGEGIIPVTPQMLPVIRDLPLSMQANQGVSGARARRFMDAVSAYYMYGVTHQELTNQLNEKRKEKAIQQGRSIVAFKDGDWNISLGFPRVSGVSASAKSIHRQIDRHIGSIQDPEERYAAFDSAAEQIFGIQAPMDGQEERVVQESPQVSSASVTR